MSYKLTWKTQIFCIVLGLIITYAFYTTVNKILENFIDNNFINYPTKYLIVNFYVYIIILMIPITLVHEALHGLMHKVFGGKVKFGFKGIYAYTQEISQRPLKLPYFIMVLLTPLTFISLLSLLFPPWIGHMILYLNLLGSTGDLLMAFITTRYGLNSKIVDRSYGFDVVK